MTMSAKPKAPSAQELDKELDDALEMTFPASDPVSVGGEGESGARPDRQAPVIDPALVERLSRQVKKKGSTPSGTKR